MLDTFRRELQEALPEGYLTVVHSTEGGKRLLVGVQKPDGTWVKGWHMEDLGSPIEYLRVPETRASHIREICAAVAKFS